MDFVFTSIIQIIQASTRASSQTQGVDLQTYYIWTRLGLRLLQVHDTV